MTALPARPRRAVPLATAAARTVPVRPAVLATVVLAAAAAGPAAAQSSPYYIGVAQTLLYDDNIVRLREGQAAPAGVSKSDTISVTSLVAGVDQRFGRQRVNGSVALRDTRFANNGQYDSNGYNLNLGLEGSTVERISGRLSATLSRTPRANVRDRQERVILERNIERVDGYSAGLSVGLVTQWSAEVGLSRSQLRYSSSAADFREYTQTGTTAGVAWRPGGATRITLGLGRQRTDYPNLLPAPDPNDRRTRDSVDFGASWEPSGASRLDLQLSQGETKHDRFTVRDFTATSGSIGWLWVPTGKLRVETRLARDTGQDSDVITTAFSRTTDRLRVDVGYALSAKVGLNAGATVYRRQLDGGGFFFGNLAGSDRGHNFGVGARWAPLRNLTLSCNLDTERRGGNSNPLLNDRYRASSLGCSGQFVLQ